MNITAANATQDLADTGLTPRQLLQTWENFDMPPGAAEKIKHVQRNADKWFLFYGNPGTGKNHVATCLLKDAVSAGKQCYCVKVLPLCLRIKSNYLQALEIIKEFSEYDFLILNEIEKYSIIRDSDRERNVLFEIIDNRYEAFKQTVFITNQTFEYIDSLYRIDGTGKNPITDRLAEMGQRVNFNWGSYRDKKAGGNQ